MFFRENARAESLCIVCLVNGHRALQDDDAMVELLVDEVYGAAGDFDSVLEGLMLRVEAGECRQQRRMNVQNALRECLDEAGREQAHVAGETNKFDAMLP